MKRDAYEFDDKWKEWKRRNFISGIKDLSKANSDLLSQYLKDMELGINTPAGRKGKRTAGTLLNLAQHNLLFLKQLDKPILDLTKEDLHKLEDRIINGKILKRNKTKFEAFGNYIKDFKAFWHWLQRTERVKQDITSDLSSKTNKPSWVYLTEEQITDFFNKLSYYYKVICFFMYDSGARVTEANSIQIKHFSKDFKQVTIPEEASKTFERTINLKLCSDLIKKFVKTEKLKDDDFLFQKDLWTINKYLKDNCGRLFGKDKVSHPKAKGCYKNFTLYDIRHNSACFWLNRYPTHKDLMYRMGWKQADKIDYYTEFLGQSDKLSDADMITAEDKPKIEQLEKEMERVYNENVKLAKGLIDVLNRLVEIEKKIKK